MITDYRNDSYHNIFITDVHKTLWLYSPLPCPDNSCGVADYLEPNIRHCKKAFMSWILAL